MQKNNSYKFLIVLVFYFLNSSSIKAASSLVKPIQTDTIDITDSLQSNLLNHSVFFLKKGVYIVRKQINIINSKIRILGESKDQVKIIFDSPNRLSESLFKITGNKIHISNITFDGNSSDVYVSLFQIGNSKGVTVSDDIQIRNCSFQNINGTANGSDNSYGIRIFINRAKNITIHSSEFKNISAFDKDKKSGSGGGFCGGIFLFSDTPLERTNFKNNIKIIHCKFDSIYTESSTKDGWDADGIRFYTHNTNPDSLRINSKIVIKKNTFIDVQKSAIKVSGISGVKITRNSVFNESDKEMLCAIRIQWGKNIMIKKTKISGKFEFGFNLIGQNIVVNRIKGNTDSYTITKNMINYQVNKIIENKNITITHIK